MNQNSLIGNKIKSIIFVCTGNTCRSPMAEILMKKLLYENNIDNVNVFSRGLSVFQNSFASENSVEAVKKYSLDLTGFRAKSLTFFEIENSDLILTMTEEHKKFIIASSPKNKDKVFTLYEFAFGINKNVSDPFGGNIEIYENCLDEIYKCIKEILNKNE